MSLYNLEAKRILELIEASNWLKQQIIALEERDVKQVLHELDVLKELFWIKYKETIRDVTGERATWYE